MILNPTDGSRWIVKVWPRQ